MKDTLFLLIPLLCLCHQATAQDTIRSAPRVQLTPAEYNNGRVNISTSAREDIVYSDTSRKIDYCYYYQEKRHCFGDTYTLLPGSKVAIDAEGDPATRQTWHYRQQADGKYVVDRLHEGLYETGIVNDLIPFGQTSIASICPATKDTLWVVEYPLYYTGRAYPRYFYPQAKIEGRVYALPEVDTPPLLPDGQPLPVKIQHPRTDGCYNEPLYGVQTLSFIITNTGDIKNIQQAQGNFDINYCPFYIMELMRIICNYGRPQPGMLKGEMVNVRYVVEVGMGE